MITDTLTSPIPTLNTTETPVQPALCFTTRATLPDVPDLGRYVPQLYDEAVRLGLTVTGPITYAYDGASGDPTHEFMLTIALPIAEQEPGTLSPLFAYEDLPKFRSVTYTHVGAWNSLPALYNKLFPAFYAQGFTATGQLREAYTVVDWEQPGRCLTEIQIGCGA